LSSTALFLPFPDKLLDPATGELGYHH
jgi:hypothetical protein